MRAARSASCRMVSRPWRTPSAGGLARQALGPRQDRAERVVQLVGDAGDRLAEHRHLLGLEQLLVEVARLVLELLALADVAQQRVDLERAGRPGRAAAWPVTSTQTGAPSARRSRSRKSATPPSRASRSSSAAPDLRDRRTAPDRTAGRPRPARRADSRTSTSGGGWRRASCCASSVSVPRWTPSCTISKSRAKASATGRTGAAVIGRHSSRGRGLPSAAVRYGPAGRSEFGSAVWIRLVSSRLTAEPARPYSGRAYREFSLGGAHETYVHDRWKRVALRRRGSDRSRRAGPRAQSSRPTVAILDLEFGAVQQLVGRQLGHRQGRRRPDRRRPGRRRPLPRDRAQAARRDPRRAELLEQRSRRSEREDRWRKIGQGARREVPDRRLDHQVRDREQEHRRRRRRLRPDRRRHRRGRHARRARPRSRSRCA